MKSCWDFWFLCVYIHYCICVNCADSSYSKHSSFLLCLPTPPPPCMLWVFSLSALVSFTRTSKHNQVVWIPEAPGWELVLGAGEGWGGVGWGWGAKRRVSRNRDMRVWWGRRDMHLENRWLWRSFISNCWIAEWNFINTKQSRSADIISVLIWSPVYD